MDILKYKRDRYARNVEEERAKANLRAKRRRAELDPEEVQRRRERHREAQARYRSKNRAKLQNDSWQYRMKKKWEAVKMQDDIEYAQMMDQM